MVKVEVGEDRWGLVTRKTGRWVWGRWSLVVG